MTPHGSESTSPVRARRRRTVAAIAYALATLASLVYTNLLRPLPPPAPGKRAVSVSPAPEGHFGIDTPLTVYTWDTPAHVREARPPVLLLHGSPGAASDWNRLAPLLAERRVIAPDLMGFGDTIRDLPDDLSIESQARMLASFLDAVGVRRAHVVGWSYGGGAAAILAAHAPERVASLTLLGSIGPQEHEGSGNYYFEQFKYALGVAGLGAMELIPHFGALGSARTRTLWLANFRDTDLRRFEETLARITVPTLVLHGRNDILVPLRSAKAVSELVPTDRLVVIDANHFIPYTDAPHAARILNEFFARHDRPGVPPRTDPLWLAPLDAGPLSTRLAEGLPLPWIVWLALIALGVRRWPRLTLTLSGLLVGGMALDPFLALCGVVAGVWLPTLMAPLFTSRRHLARLAATNPDLHATFKDWSDRLSRAPIVTAWRSVFVPYLCRQAVLGVRAPGPGFLDRAQFVLGRLAATLVWGMLGLLAAQTAGWLLLRELESAAGHAGAALAVLLCIPLVGLVTALPSRMARQRIRAHVSRATHHEWWPAWLFYPPIVAYVAFVARRFGGLLTCTCVNPGIPPGGGIVNESKHAAMLAIAHHPEALPTILIPAGPDPAERASLAAAAIHDSPGFSLPVILKPDAAQRGFAVRLIEREDELLDYFRAMTRDAILQPCHPGPHEAGILWIRAPGSPSGRIFSITRKQFQYLEGDGRSTIEELIHAHPRHRCQSDVFLTRFAGRLAETPPLGRRLRLAVAGNHAQGTLFRDGSDLITPELERAIDRICSTFRGGGVPGTLDCSRLDVRYASDEALRRGEGFAVVELNGLFGESTNIYDPDRSVFWAWRVLARQWHAIYELGAERRAAGITPLRWRDFFALLRAHYRDRRGPPISS